MSAKYAINAARSPEASGDVSLGTGLSIEMGVSNVPSPSNLGSMTAYYAETSQTEVSMKRDVKKKPSVSKKKESDRVHAKGDLQLLAVLWSSVLPKMTVLVVSSDLVFTTLLSQMVIGLGATPVVVASPNQTRQILRHRLKYATDIAIIVHQSECYSTVLSLDDMQSGDGNKDVPTETEEQVDGIEDISPHAAALDYQPWYDIASKVRHRKNTTGSGDTITAVDDTPVIAVSVIAVITGNPEGDDELVSHDRFSIASHAQSWDPCFAQCLHSEVVVPLVAPFTRTNFVLALGHMKQRVGSGQQGQAENEMPDHVVLSVCEDAQERSASALVLRKAGVDNVAVDHSQLQAALMLQQFDCILLHMGDTTKERSSWWPGQKEDTSAMQVCKDTIAYIRTDLAIGTPIVVLTKDIENTKEELEKSGAGSVIQSPCTDTLVIYTAIVGLKEDPKASAPRNRNRNQQNKSTGEQGITSTDGVSKTMGKPKRRNSTFSSDIAAAAKADTMLAGRLAERRGSWSGGWVSMVSSDARKCAYVRGATHHVPQDRVVLMDDFREKGHTFFGTFDGHGPLGHHISTFISQTISQLLLKDDQVQCEEDYVEAIPRVCAEAFRAMREMHQDAAQESGCTAAFGIVGSKSVYVGNVGDSRTCFVRNKTPGCCGMLGSSITVEAISVDHTPVLESEAERVKACGALVMQMGPVLRVVHPSTAGGNNMRGLAMSKSFGDLWAYDIGVVPEPDVFVHPLGPDDRYIMCGSDGIWDMLKLADVAKFLPSETDDSNTGDLSRGVKKAVEVAVTEWKSQGMEADDCSLIVIAV